MKSMKPIFSNPIVAILIALLVMTPITLSTTGCPANASAQVRADGAAIAQAITSIAALETQQGNTALAQNLTLAANSLVAATQNFSSGSATKIITTAATALEIALAAIPATAAYAPLLPIAVAAIDALLANIGAAPVSLTSAKVGLTGATAVRLGPLKNFQVKHRFGRSRATDFKDAWNNAVKSYNLANSLLVK